MIHLAASFTPGYAWLPGFRASLEKHCNIPYTLLEVNAPGQTFDIVHDKLYRVPRAPETRTTMLQHGAFLPWLDLDFYDPVILFSDADMIMQRPLTETEISEFYALSGDNISCGLNGPRGETLLEEARLLGPKAPLPTVSALFPGFETLPAWNTGFVAARRTAWARLYDMTRALMPVAELCFEHYAAVQWVMCYCLGKWLTHVELPQTIHLHGCWGLPAGASVNEAGEALFNGQLVAFRHAINLTPPKGITVTK